MEELLIEIIGKERHEHLIENSKDKVNENYSRSLNTRLGKLNFEVTKQIDTYIIFA